MFTISLLFLAYTPNFFAISIGIYLFILLLRRRNRYPYIFIKPLWEKIILSITTLLSLCLFILINFQVECIKFYFTLLFPGLFDIILLLAILMRFIFLRGLGNFNRIYLSQDSMEERETFKYKKTEKDYKQKSLSFNYLKNIKFFLGITVIYSIFYILLSIFSSKKTPDKTTSTQYFLGITFSYLLVLGFFYFSLDIIKNPLQKDIFLINLEVIGNLVISFICIELKYTAMFFRSFLYDSNDFPIKLWIFNESFYYISIVSLYGLLIYYRNNNFSNYPAEITQKNFEEFMENKASFNIFKRYVFHCEEESWILLLFWIDYKYFIEKITFPQGEKEISLEKSDQDIKRTSKGESKISKEEKDIVDQAKAIFNDYFGNPDKSVNKEKSMFLIIDFPIDILEKVVEVSKNNFQIDDCRTIYNDAFYWVNEKLKKLYEKFLTKKEEINEVHKVLFFSQCFEIENNMK